MTGRALTALIAVAALTWTGAGCGGDDGSGGDDAPVAAEPVRLIQTALSGSFLGSGDGELQLVLRGVGGSTAIAAAGPGGAPAGAISTARLLRAGEAVLGPEPLRATLSGAEIDPLGYDLLLSEGSYDARVGAIAYRAEIESGQPELPPGSFGAATLVIESGLEPQTLSGSVAAATGDGGEEPPLEGALVAVEFDGLGIATTRTAADGSFELGPLPAGSYGVEATLDGYERDATELELPTTEPPRLLLTPIGEGG